MSSGNANPQREGCNSRASADACTGHAIQDYNNIARLFFSFWDFDEHFYLDKYPDLVASIPSPHFSNAFHHFCMVGYREGRLPANPMVDEQWYINQYSDVAHAVVMGSV